MEPDPWTEAIQDVKLTQKLPSPFTRTEIDEGMAFKISLALVVLLTQRLHLHFTFSLPHTDWYTKQHPTFADALAFVRRYLWVSRLFQTSRDGLEYVKVPCPLFDTWTDLLCHAA